MVVDEAGIASANTVHHGDDYRGQKRRSIEPLLSDPILYSFWYFVSLLQLDKIWIFARMHWIVFPTHWDHTSWRQYVLNSVLAVNGDLTSSRSSKDDGFPDWQCFTTEKASLLARAANRHQWVRRKIFHFPWRSYYWYIILCHDNEIVNLQQRQRRLLDPTVQWRSVRGDEWWWRVEMGDR